MDVQKSDRNDDALRIDAAALQWLLGQVQSGASPGDVVAAMVGRVDGVTEPAQHGGQMAVAVGVLAHAVRDLHDAHRFRGRR